MKRIGAAVVMVLAGGCGIAGADNDLRVLEVSIASAATLGQSSALALEAMSGSGSVQCATVVSGCEAYPCDGEVRIDYGGGCPLPLGGEAVGSTTVTGSWSAEDQATLDFTFTDVRVGDRGSVLASATTIGASRSEGITTVEFTGSSAVTRGAVAVAASSSWDVVVNDSGTPDDPADDSYTIDGTSAAAGGASARAVTVDQALVTPDCRRNPVAGTARVTESGLNVRTDEITFLASCEGTAELEPTLGGPRTVELDFLED